jgi:hypothetical protein
MLKETPQQANPEADLKAALGSFEESILTPVVSGDLPTWVEQVRATWTEASAQIHYHVKQLHPRQYEQIAEQDPELLPRVELLKADDELLERQRDEINQLVVLAAQLGPNLEPDEEKATRHLQRLIDASLQFIAQVRKQNVAVQTWFSEAFTRDRGAVD